MWNLHGGTSSILISMFFYPGEIFPFFDKAIGNFFKKKTVNSNNFANLLLIFSKILI